jgi:hypothetical protein
MKKSIIVFMFVLVGILLYGCMDTNNTQTHTSLYDELKALPESERPNRHTINYSSMSEEEFNARVVIRAGRMYGDLTDYRYRNKIGYMKYEKKYGIDDFAQLDCMYWFLTLEDMEVVFKNHEFLEDYFHEYGFELNIDSYHTLPISIRTQYEHEPLVIALVVIDGGHHFYFSGGLISGSTSISWGMFDVEKRVTLDTVVDFYARKDDLKIQYASLDNGNAVYYTSSDKSDCTLFNDMGVTTSNITTAYLWEQDGIIGVVIVPGEHKDENFDMCIFEKHMI